jgi:prevent-host-death family protein
METVGVRELKQRTTQVLRRVREKKEKIQVTYRGKVVALLVPVADTERQASAAEQAVWADLDQLAAEIGASWPAGVSAVDAIREDRR